MFDLTMLNGKNGFRIEGLNELEWLGYSVSTAGDVNGDGKSDVVVGAPCGAASGGPNTVYVIFGQASGWPASFNLTTLDGSNGFSVEGLDPYDFLGKSVSTAGDMNEDGKSDLVLGADLASPGGQPLAGMVYVLLSQASGWPASFNLATLDGNNGFSVEGLDAYDFFGVSVSTAGDVNGDGRLDLVLGNNADPGAVYVLFGQESGWPLSFNLTTLDGNNGFSVEGLNLGDYLGGGVDTAGDFNGDSLSDLVLGAFGASPGGRNEAGTAYVIFGQTSGWPASFDLTTLDGNNGFSVEGLNEGGSLGFSVSTAGDMNGDGISDLVLGAPLSGNRTGAAYVIFGQASDWPVSFNLTSLNGSNGFRVEGLNTGDQLGVSISTAGDMNSDGISDLVLGANRASPGGRDKAGMAYVLFGQESGWPASFNLTALNFINGFRIEGLNVGDRLGWSVSTAGDMNGDRRSDLVLGARHASPGGQYQAGLAYVILANRPPQVIYNISDKVVELNQLFRFQLASDTFNDPDGDNMTYSAVQSGESALPSWLKFDAAHFFSGTPTQTGITPITVTAKDPYGLTANTSFNLDVQNLASGIAGTNIGAIIGGIVGGVAAAAIGGLAGAAYLAYKRGFFGASNRDEDNQPTEPDTEIELNKKTAISAAG